MISQVLLPDNVKIGKKMKNKEYLEKEAEATLNCLDGTEKALPGPYLFTRVKAALDREEKNFWAKALTFMSRPSIAFGTIVIAVFINAFIFFEFRNESSPSGPEGEQQFANDYNLADNTIYDSTIEPE